jgi:hypothetical protein
VPATALARTLPVGASYRRRTRRRSDLTAFTLRDKFVPDRCKDVFVNLSTVQRAGLP